MVHDLHFLEVISLLTEDDDDDLLGLTDNLAQAMLLGAWPNPSGQVLCYFSFWSAELPLRSVACDFFLIFASRSEGGHHEHQ